jgi:hypothetical protein
MPAVGENMSEKSVRLPVEPRSNRCEVADCINRAFETSDIAKFVKPLALPPVCTTSLTLRRNLELKGKASIALLQAVHSIQTSKPF